jgi:hypothetical protein
MSTNDNRTFPGGSTSWDFADPFRLSKLARFLEKYEQ